tara:strand:+ start:426 stop:599 length:174 start_codon:yes stop_codon:yes gene_type:complete
MPESIPDEILQAGFDAIDAYRERIAICVIDGEMTEALARQIALADFRKGQNNERKIA